MTYIIKLIRFLLHYLNKRKINLLGKNTLLHCRIEKRDKNSKIEIQDDCLIYGRLVTETDQSIIRLGNNVFIGGNSIIDCKEEICIEDNVLVSYECIIFDHDSHSVDKSKRENDLYRFKNNKMNWNEVKSKKINIKKNVWICARSIILKGVTIGEGSIVGAGSVVTQDVPDFSLVSGNPAKFIRKVQ